MKILPSLMFIPPFHSLEVSFQAHDSLSETASPIPGSWLNTWHTVGETDWKD